MDTLENQTRMWRFGVFEVDALNFELRRNGVAVRIREQPFRILVFLLEHAGELVSREDLRRLLWADDTYVDFDHSLNTAMMKLREALGDSAEEPLYIETVPKRGYRFVAPAQEMRAETVPVESGPPAVPIEERTKPRSRLFRGGYGIWLSAVLLAMLGVVASVVVVRFRAPKIQTDAGAGSGGVALQAEPITTDPGIAQYPVFSPEGGAIAYVWTGSENQQQDVFVHMLGVERPLQITHSKAGRIGIPTWSPDGSQIAFTRCDGKNNGVFAVPALGGNERKLTDVACTDRYHETNPIRWLSDNQTMLMIDRCTKEGAFGIVALSLATGNKHCVTYSKDVPDPVSIIMDFAVSPDEKTIAFLAPSAKTFSEVFTIPTAGGTPRQITHEGPIGGCSKGTDVGCTALTWTPDGLSIVFGMNTDQLSSLWSVSANGGRIRRETSYPAVGSFSRDGRRMVFSAETGSKPQAIWRADFAAPGGPVLENRAIVRTQLDETDAQPSPDHSQIVWMSERTGAEEIWTSSATGENPFQLTHLKGYSGTPRWSPDGKRIAFDSVTAEVKATTQIGAPQIHIVDADGRNLQKITAGRFENVVPSWSRDGKWIYFASNRTGTWQVWRHSLENGSEAQITQQGGFDPFESPDGTTVYFSKFDMPGIWSVSRNGGPETAVIPDKPQVGFWGHWALTNSGLYFLDATAQPRRIEFYDFATHRTRPVLTFTALPAPLQPALSATMDGKTIFYTQEDFESSLKLVTFSLKH